MIRFREEVGAEDSRDWQPCGTWRALDGVVGMSSGARPHQWLVPQDLLLKTQDLSETIFSLFTVPSAGFGFSLSTLVFLHLAGSAFVIWMVIYSWAPVPPSLLSWCLFVHDAVLFKVFLYYSCPPSYVDGFCSVSLLL